MNLLIPTSRQANASEVDQLPAGDVLLLSAPGCGKTERLARHAAALVRSGDVADPQKILAVTFSIRARSNLATRIRTQLGPRAARRHVEIATFHGFAHRLFRNHGRAVGVDPLLLVAPQRGWVEQLRSEVAREYRVLRNDLDSILTAVKRDVISDEEMRKRLVRSGSPAAVAYQERLDGASRIDFDDLLRYGTRLLAVPAVRELYQARFATVLVDEVQDLGRLHYILIADLGTGRTVFAGDHAQGIYRFAGAEPDWVFAQVHARNPAIVPLGHSHRSSPPVLRVVGALATELGGGPLESADPARWAGRGHVEVLRFRNVQSEAAAVVRLVQEWLAQDPTPCVGVMARTAARRAYIDDAVRAASIAAEVWDDPISTARVVDLLHAHASGAIAAADNDASRIDELHRRCQAALDPDDIEARDDVTSACVSLRERTAVVSLVDALDGIRVASDPDEPTSPGLHLLNGHLGKGQQFTKVIIVGLEEDFIPHFAAIKKNDPAEIRDELAVLHVMASRAEEELIFTVTENVPTRNGYPRLRQPSRWFNSILQATTVVPNGTQRPSVTSDGQASTLQDQLR
ncbi:UvrD-helicase domain-containing protein [Parafrankia discariae]|uniref:UvrD-helicase domain-containing protein n=1 Tax=Parafrankia discariae TaxID=365528 RepID=UPI0003783406|nr:ATP-dependent helicase [Parafrankia discariae]